MMYRIYYANGAHIDGHEGTVPEMPALGVQVIVQYDDSKDVWYLQSGSDNYIWRDGLWVGVDNQGRTNYLVTPGWKRILFGETIRNKSFLSILQAAKAHRDFWTSTGVKP